MTSIIYVNYAPYENSGHILDYLKKKFADLIQVSFIFHPVKRRSSVNIFHQGQLIKTISLPTLVVSSRWVHYLAPLLSFIQGLELVVITIYVSLKFKIKPQIFLAPNAFLIFIGIILRGLSLVDKVIFWVWDYYPVPEKGFYLKLYYRAYWVLDSWCTKKADFVWYLNRRLLEIRKKRGVVIDMSKSGITPLGIDVVDVSSLPQVSHNVLGFLGVLKKKQGLELLFDSLSALAAAIPEIKIEIIGAGPDEEYFKKLAGNSPEGHRIKFYGFIDDEQKMKMIVASWAAAVALYVPTEENVAAYADPAKVKFYLGYATPVIITKVPLLAEEIHQKEAGIAIEYKTEQLVSAVLKVFGKNEQYRENARSLAGEYDYRKIYDNAFKIISKQINFPGHY